MADNAETSGGAQVTFKVKTSGDKTHTITISEAATVSDLKTLLAGDDYEKVPAERQRLIYSGRVLKNEDTVGSYKIKPNNTVHMVKSAASNPTPPAPASGAGASNSTPQSTGVPSNMASGTANNPLAGLTGARYAGHQINLPGMDMFGPDGGMGPPMDEERLTRMMEDPNTQQQMNEALSNPDFVNMIVDSNPMLRNLPNAREILQSPYMRQMLTNPQMMQTAMRMRQGQGQGSAFPAPGATDTTPQNAPADGGNGQGDAQQQQQQQQNPFGGFMPPFPMGGLGGMGGAGGEGAPNLQQMLQQLQGLSQGMPQAQGQDAAAGTTGQGNEGAATGQQGQEGTQQNAQANPFAALFPGAGGAGAPQGGGNNPFGMNPEAMSEMLRMLGGGGGGAGFGGEQQAPPDNRPPEERYEDQLRQLNDMGFFDFDRNVAALRRSGGSVQGAVEYLLSN